ECRGHRGERVIRRAAGLKGRRRLRDQLGPRGPLRPELPPVVRPRPGEAAPGDVTPPAQEQPLEIVEGEAAPGGLSIEGDPTRRPIEAHLSRGYPAPEARGLGEGGEAARLPSRGEPGGSPRGGWPACFLTRVVSCRAPRKERRVRGGSRGERSGGAAAT